MGKTIFLIKTLKWKYAKADILVGNVIKIEASRGNAHSFKAIGYEYSVRGTYCGNIMLLSLIVQSTGVLHQLCVKLQTQYETGLENWRKQS